MASLTITTTDNFFKNADALILQNQFGACNNCGTCQSHLCGFKTNDKYLYKSCADKSSLSVTNNLILNLRIYPDKL